MDGGNMIAHTLNTTQETKKKKQQQLMYIF